MTRRGRGVRDVAWEYDAVPALVGASAIVGWFAWSLSNQRPAYPGEHMQSYLAQFLLVDPHHPDLGQAGVGDILVRLPRAAISQAAHAAEVLTGLPWVNPSWVSPLVVIVLLVCGLGWWIEFRRPNQLTAWYAVCYAGVLLLWPFDEGQRFLVPALPLLFLFFAAGGRTLTAWSGTSVTHRLGRRWAWMRLLMPAGATLWLAAFAFEASHLESRRVSIYRLGPDGVPDVPVRYAVEWVRAHTAPGDVVMAANYATLHYWTHRLTVPLPITGRAAIMVAALERTRPRFIVIEDPPDHPYYFPVEPERLQVLERSFPGEFEPQYRFPGGQIYRWRGHGSKS